MKYTVVVFNGDYSPSHPYAGKDKDIAIAVATAYINKGKRVRIVEEEEGSDNGK